MWTWRYIGETRESRVATVAAFELLCWRVRKRKLYYYVELNTSEVRSGQNDTVLDSDASTSFKCHEMNSLTIKFDAPITVCAPYRDWWSSPPVFDYSSRSKFYWMLTARLFSKEERGTSIFILVIYVNGYLIALDKERSHWKIVEVHKKTPF